MVLKTISPGCGVQIPRNLQNFWKCHHGGHGCSVVSCTLCAILSINIYNNVSYHTIMNSQNTHKIFIHCMDVCVQVCMCSSVWRNPLKINLNVWFYFIVFLTILCNICETGHIELSILVSLHLVFVQLHLRVCQLTEVKHYKNPN